MTLWLMVYVEITYSNPFQTLNALQTASASFNNLIGWLETQPDYEDLIRISLKSRQKVRKEYTETIDKEIDWKLYKITDANELLFPINSFYMAHIFNLDKFDESRFFEDFQREHKQIIENHEDEMMNNPDQNEI